MTTWQLIHSDYKKYRKYGGSFIGIVFFTQGFWAIFQYRLANAVYRKIKWQPFRLVFKGLLFLWQKVIELTTGISIPASVQIGHSFYIGHFGGIFLNQDVIIGNNCNLSQNVTVGVSGLGEKRGVPIIGDNVYIAANSIVAGKIFIADGALIGACSLVTSDVAPQTTVLGVPAQVISQNGSKEYI
ncbi:serine acetyltransferase [Flavobacterium sp. CYK-55]|uniref:serine O-acetyltransferase n=1 Tax=Flavobacterium sp. CYK-55 TaxID=2835529 RepID=UPI001BCE57BD|nr:serine acetyltransferase [Flavobacterium sp. CYK-55]MBS7786397.1 serine acetyltransferase [Flavobacterium sp. CYK-55]